MKRLATAALAFAASQLMGLAVANATPATPLKKNGNECIFISTVGNYRVLDDRNLVIWAPGRRDAYHVELSFPLFSLNSSFQMAMIDKDRDGRLCGFSTDRIGVRDFGHPESASIRSMTKLDKGGIVELEQKYKTELRSKKEIAKDAEQNPAS
jgi:Family of unknown function (DUF6491)